MTSAYRSSAALRCRVSVVRLTVVDSRSPAAPSDEPISASSPAISRASRDFVPSSSRPAAIEARPSFPLGVERLARLDDQVEGHDRQVVALDDPELQAVGELAALEARGRVVGGRPEHWA